MAHTRAVCSAGHYTARSKPVELPSPTGSVQMDPCSSTTGGPRFDSTEIVVSCIDTIQAALEKRRRFKDGKLLVLNMANRQSPGGPALRLCTFLLGASKSLYHKIFFYFPLTPSQPIVNSESKCKQQIVNCLCRRLPEGQPCPGGGSLPAHHSQLCPGPCFRSNRELSLA